MWRFEIESIKRRSWLNSLALGGIKVLPRFTDGITILDRVSEVSSHAFCGNRLNHFEAFCLNPSGDTIPLCLVGDNSPCFSLKFGCACCLSCEFRGLMPWFGHLIPGLSTGLTIFGDLKAEHSLLLGTSIGEGSINDNFLLSLTGVRFESELQLELFVRFLPLSSLMFSFLMPASSWSSLLSMPSMNTPPAWGSMWYRRLNRSWPRFSPRSVWEAVNSLWRYLECFYEEKSKLIKYQGK